MKIFFEKHLELINNSPYLCSPTRKEKELFLFYFFLSLFKGFENTEKKNKKNFRKYLEDML